MGGRYFGVIHVYFIQRVITGIANNNSENDIDSYLLFHSCYNISCVAKLFEQF